MSRTRSARIRLSAASRSQSSSAWAWPRARARRRPTHRRGHRTTTSGFVGTSVPPGYVPANKPVPPDALAVITKYLTVHGPPIGTWAITSVQASTVDPTLRALPDQPRGRSRERAARRATASHARRERKWIALGFGTDTVGCPPGAPDDPVVPAKVFVGILDHAARRLRSVRPRVAHVCDRGTTPSATRTDGRTRVARRRRAARRRTRGARRGRRLRSASGTSRGCRASRRWCRRLPVTSIAGGNAASAKFTGLIAAQGSPRDVSSPMRYDIASGAPSARRPGPSRSVGG